MNTNANIERSVLAGYLLIDLTPDCFKKNCRKKLDVDIFSVPFHKRIAYKINEALDEKMPLPLLCMTLSSKIEENKLAGNYEDDFLDILATNPLGNDYGLYQYIEVLKEKKIQREIND